MRYSQLRQRWQKSQSSRVALHTPRTWRISLGAFVISLLLVAALLPFKGHLSAVLPSPLASLISALISTIVVIPFLCFFLALFCAVFTDQAYKIKAYRKELKTYLATSMNSYYAPAGSQGVQWHLTALMKGKEGLLRGQERHLLMLGGPGSGKTANLKYTVYQAVSSGRQRKENKLPVLIQMKYYNGFLRNLRVALPALEATPAETLLAYLLDDVYEQESQSEKEPELIGLQYLRPYLLKLFAEGQLVLLCDGMNELESEALTTVHEEIKRFMHTTRNSVVMTCRELEYQEQELLQDLASEGVAIKTLPPLTDEDVNGIVRVYLQSQRAPGQVPLSDAAIEEAQEQVRRLSRSYRETSPFMLIMLIQALKNPEAQARTISRGRLLRLTVDQRPLVQETATRVFGDHPDAQNVKDFLSAVACTARRNGQRNAVQLVKDTRFTTSSQLQDFLNVWLSDNEVDVGNFTQTNIGKYLRIALDAGLITISNNGVLSFMHELIAEYFAAEYLRFIYHRRELEDEYFWHSIYESEVAAAGLWSEPVAIWAGLEEQPKEIARFLMTNIDYYCLQKGMDSDESDFYHYHALALSLGCLGVRASDGLPEETLSYLKQSVLVKEKHEQLAMIFKRCADEGGIGVYQALLPYIHISGMLDCFIKIHDQYREKDNSTILAMLFEYLEKVATDPACAEQTQALITILGEIGRRGDETVRLRARQLSGPPRPPLLRAAAINILELLRNPSDVPLLMSYLYAPEKEVIGPAITAVRIFGPDFTLALLEREEAKLRSVTQAQTRLNFLRVLEGFLEPDSSNYPVAERHTQTLISLLIHFLSEFDKEPTWRLAQKLLNQQMQKSSQDASRVTLYLLDALETEDQKQAEHIQELLKQNCLQIFGTITNCWKTRRRREVTSERIIAVLGQVSDKSILEFLLQQLDESEPGMQNVLASAISQQQDSTDPLLEALLAPTTTPNIMRVASMALQQTGETCVFPLCEKLLNIRSYADATEDGLRCLIHVLDECRKSGFISREMEEQAVRSLTTLFDWLIENAAVHVPLAAETIPVMVGFSDHRIVVALLNVLARSGVLLEQVCQEAITGLSQLGELAVGDLIKALNSPKETTLTRRVRQVLLRMEPFPREQLLATFAHAESAVVQQIMWLFVARQQEAETVRFLVKRLLESSNDSRVFDNVKQTLVEMQPECMLPYLIEVMGQPNWRVIMPLLRGCPQPEYVLSLLTKDLADLQRYLLVLEVLREEFNYPLALPWLVSGLANEQTRQHTRSLIERMARTYEGNLIPEIVHLFNPAIARPEPLPADLLPEVHKALQELLTTELARESLPALVMGLAEPALREGCIDSLVALAHNQQRQDVILRAILHALRNPSQRLGAHQTLVRCGPLAAQAVCELIMESDPELVREARTILAGMGETALPYIYQLAHDPQNRAHAEDIMQRIPAEIIARGLLACFASNDRQKEEIAFYLLAMGLDNENSSRPGNLSLTGELLAQIMQHEDSRIRLRTLSALLFFYHERRAELAQHIVSAITQTPEEYDYAEYVRMLSLLGRDAVDALGFAINMPGLPEQARLEMVGTLASLAEDEQVTEYVNILAGGTNGTLNFSLRALGLRALGGLLAGGIYSEKRLEEIRKGLSASSKPQDIAAFEFFDVLLGKRSLPELVNLRETLNKQQDVLNSLNKLTPPLKEEFTQA